MADIESGFDKLKYVKSAGPDGLMVPGTLFFNFQVFSVLL